MNILSRPSAAATRLVALGLFVAVTCSSCGLFSGWRERREKEAKNRGIRSLGDYRLSVGSVAALQMFEGGDSTLEADVTVGPGGDVLIPGVGEVSVDGMTPLDAAKKIEFLSRRSGQNHLSGPRVHIKALDRVAVVHVSGEVKNSGPVTFDRGLTVAGAIRAAGGASEEANPRSVGLTSEGRSRIITNPESRELREGDVVNVPRRLAAPPE